MALSLCKSLVVDACWSVGGRVRTFTAPFPYGRGGKERGCAGTLARRGIGGSDAPARAEQLLLELPRLQIARAAHQCLVELLQSAFQALLQLLIAGLRIVGALYRPADRVPLDSVYLRAR